MKKIGLICTAGILGYGMKNITDDSEAARWKSQYAMRARIGAQFITLGLLGYAFWKREQKSKQMMMNIPPPTELPPAPTPPPPKRHY